MGTLLRKIASIPRSTLVLGVFLGFVSSLYVYAPMVADLKQQQKLKLEQLKEEAAAAEGKSW